MSQAETLLVLGALIIFSMAALMVNDVKFENERTMIESEFQITAIGLAQSYIQEAQRLSFDEVTVDSAFAGNIPIDFTSADNMGAETGEAYPGFDDLDDFNDFNQDITTPRADYTVDITVMYADTATLAPDLLAKSVLKLMTVRVSSIFFQDTITCRYMFGYH